MFSREPAAEDAQIAGPRAALETRLWGAAIILFGASFILAGVRRENFLYSLAGVGTALFGVVLLFRYDQTLVDLTHRTWSRTRGGLLSKQSKTGSLDEIVGINVRQGTDSKGYAFWEVLLDRAEGESVPWHLYTYLGKAGMERDIERLRSALGVPVEFRVDEG